MARDGVERADDSVRLGRLHGRARGVVGCKWRARLRDRHMWRTEDRDQEPDAQERRDGDRRLEDGLWSGRPVCAQRASAQRRGQYGDIHGCLCFICFHSRQ